MDEAYQTHLVSNEDTGELVELGRTDVALDVLAKRGEWDRVWEVAAKERLSPSGIGKFVLMRVEELVRGGSTAQMDEAIKTLHKRPGPASEGAMNTYRRLVRSVLARPSTDEGPELAASVASLREVLYRLANQYRSHSSDKQVCLRISFTLACLCVV